MNESVYYVCSIIIGAITSAATVGGVIFACIQLCSINKSRKKQYEQLRREKTVELVTYYVQNSKNKTVAVEKIVLGLTDEQCIDLYNCTPFVVDHKTRDKICEVCPYADECRRAEDGWVRPCEKNNPDKPDEKEYYVSSAILHSIRGSVITFLNVLECVLLAWQLGIVDQKTIKEQFVFLDKKRAKERALATFRSIAGMGHSYPAIEKFYQHLEQEHREEAKRNLKEIIE